MAKIFVLAVLIVIVVGSYMIIEANNLDIKDSGDRTEFAKEFWGWSKKVGQSSVNVIGYAVHQDWMPNVNESDACRYDDKSKEYITKDKDCKINFICEKNKSAFKDRCGCGCKYS